MRIQWVCSPPSEILCAVMKDMSANISFMDFDDFFQSFPNRRSDTHDVLIMELGDRHQTLPADCFKHWFTPASKPLTLVLLPHTAAHQAIAYLNAGADRCMPRDSDVRLIQAMIRAMLHRCNGQMATYTEHGLLRFEHDTRTLFQQSQRIPLTHRETQVAGVLFQQARRYIRHDQILRVLSAEAHKEIKPALVSLYVHRINRKIQPYGVHIGFKRGYGYRLYVDSLQDNALQTLAWPGFLPTNTQSASKPTPAQRLHDHA